MSRYTSWAPDSVFWSRIGKSPRVSSPSVDVGAFTAVADDAARRTLAVRCVGETRRRGDDVDANAARVTPAADMGDVFDYALGSRLVRALVPMMTRGRADDRR